MVDLVGMVDMVGMVDIIDNMAMVESKEIFHILEEVDQVSPESKISYGTELVPIANNWS